MSTLTQRVQVLLAIGASVLAGVPVAAQVAQPPSAVSPTGDPPGRVGRLGFIQGTVSFRAAGDSAWAPAVPNRPVSTGDALWADTDGRAEVEIGSAALRIDRETELDVLRLDDGEMQLSVPQGTAIVRLRALATGETDEIDAPNAAIEISTLGEYRVDVSPDGLTTSISVLSGSAYVTAGGESFPVNAGQVATVQGDSTATYNVADIGSADAFDQWSESRDAREDAAAASVAHYVSPYMPGTADLEAYGGWESDATYGPVWYPRTVVAGWAPYRFGHWVWMGRFGWTWVDDAPWGWAPFHYGRWAYLRGRWGWCPGRTIAPPVFAPALVVFLNDRGWSASVSFGPQGGVGWFPLAPNEVYRPPYTVSSVYVRRVNVTNVNITNINVTNVNITNINYRNRGVADAVTVVRQETFVTAMPVGRATVRVPADEMKRVTVFGAAPVVPTRSSLLSGQTANRRAALPPTALARRPVLAVHAPPPAPVPFSAQQRLLATNSGRPLTHTQVVQLRKEAPAQATVVRARPATTVLPGGATLRPARTGLPAARPATEPPPARSNVAPRPAVPTTVPKAPAKPPTKIAQPAVPPERLTPGAPITPKGTSTTSRDALDKSYVQQRQQMEQRHAQEFAKPPAGETMQQITAKQDSEHRDLEARYQQAAAEGKRTLPSAANPQTKPQTKPQTQSSHPATRPATSGKPVQKVAKPAGKP